MRIGIIGCGRVSHHYLRELRKHPWIEVAACADTDPQAASALADGLGAAAFPSAGRLLEASPVEAVLNLTPPRSHAQVTLAALEAGRHVYSEKPLATTRADALTLLATAERRRLVLGCAPDTFLGATLQTARRLLDDQVIGRPVAAVACFASLGWEHRHPRPEFFYLPGAGPMLDMAPYYVTSLVTLLGPVRRVSGLAGRGASTRQVSSDPLRPRRIRVEVPTHVTGSVELVSGVLVTLLASFDIAASGLPPLEIYGTAGTLSLPPPDTFGGPVGLYRRGTGQWERVPAGGDVGGRGIGLAEMSEAIAAGRPPRAGAPLAYHVLDALLCLLESSELGYHRTLASSCDRPQRFEGLTGER
jgi:predicted dehydrogenase